MAKSASSSFTKSLAHFFDAAVRERGRSYFENELVIIQVIKHRGILATVLGSGDYEYEVGVVNDGAGDELSVWCECPHFDSGHLCKHLWATLLEAELQGGFAVGHVTTIIQSFNESENEKGYVFSVEDVEAGSRKKTKSVLPSVPSPPPQPPPIVDPWKIKMNQMVHHLRDDPKYPSQQLPRDYEIFYVLKPMRASAEGQLHLEIYMRKRTKSGVWSKPKIRRIESNQVDDLHDPVDREILSLSKEAVGYTYYSHSGLLNAHTQRVLVRMMCATGRCFVDGRVPGLDSDESMSGISGSPVDVERDPWALVWDDGGVWDFALTLEPDGAGGYQLGGEWRRGDERMAHGSDTRVTEGGLVFYDGHVGVFEGVDAGKWGHWLGDEGGIEIPEEQVGEFVERLMSMPRLPVLDLPVELRYTMENLEPRPCLTLWPNKDDHQEKFNTFYAGVSFDYDGHVVALLDDRPGVFDSAMRRFLLRDKEIEKAAFSALIEAGATLPARWEVDAGLDAVVKARHFTKVVDQLVRAGWWVEAEGKRYRSGASDMRIDVTSGIDWFEVHGSATFDDQDVALPQLLAALRHGENFVPLGDGSFGLLPEAWLKRFAPLAGAGELVDDHLRLRSSHIAVLDAMLEAMPEVSFDAQVAKARKKLAKFAGVKPRSGPRGFKGELRDYQEAGLGWLHFLREFGFGGCLADDMGLGKTVMVLGLLESRRQQRKRDKGATPPSLVVAPRSIIYNWIAEAKRFTPHLRVLDHTGTQRFGGRGAEADAIAHFADYDLILTTYGTLRIDAAKLKERRFDYVILDESQMIKNARTATAKASRLIDADHRLGLSGTPIENHLGELFSLFEFLNPGMLGDPGQWMEKNGQIKDDGYTHDLLVRTLRPFILRRTKGEVAKELPAKTEQTQLVKLSGTQRKQYDELRRHYRTGLMQTIEQKGLNRSKIQVLEALLRLRQAACHPGLIDESKRDKPSAKLDSLLPQLLEVMEEGHKALVFSQFTGFLGILRDKLDALGINYQYLDGRTRKREACVERFQKDADCQLFLISLKAGGVGLNLTAAEYVFLLDPWWNPAVEAQAIDRAHRIGQTQQVFAYRLIAEDTIEQKVLELQQSKKDLANSIIAADGNVIRDLTVDDLRALLD